MANEWKDLVYVDVMPKKLIAMLDKALTKLAGAIKLLTNIMKILQLFISAFSSFSALLQTFIIYGKQVVNQFSESLSNSGVYVNILIPPAFLKPLMQNKNYANMASGGFEGFLSRLHVSLNNPADINAPRFSSNAVVGGFIILVDANTLDEFFRAMDFLASTFGFMDLFPINAKPMPPINARGSSGYFVQPDGTKKFGIKLIWDAPSVRGFTSYRLSRSLKSGGVRTTVEKIPTKLIGPRGHEDEGIIVATMIKIRTNKWPLFTEYVYDDKKGGTKKIWEPKIIGANIINGGGEYIDYDEIDTGNVNQYYYVIESGFKIGNLWGPRCAEIMVPTYPKNCISTAQAETVDHPGGDVELLSQGVGPLGQWSSIQAKLVLPFLPKIVDLLNVFLDKLAGSLKTNSKAFIDFINDITKTMKKYVNYLNALSAMILAIENFFFAMPKISYLSVPTQPGGVNKFYNSVANAKQPPEGFSGKTGTTAGIVFVWGAIAGIDEKEMQDKIKAIEKSFKIIKKILS